MKLCRQQAAVRFSIALNNYRQALESGNSEEIIMASLAMYAARRSELDRRMINRVYKDTSRKVVRP